MLYNTKLTNPDCTIPYVYKMQTENYLSEIKRLHYIITTEVIQGTNGEYNISIVLVENNLIYLYIHIKGTDLIISAGTVDVSKFPKHD
jgi:hypothetical protein